MAVAIALLIALPGVKTPTGNIRCFYVSGPPAHLLCSVHRASYSTREQDACMARAGLDWHGWRLYDRRPPETVCAGGILYDSNTSVPRVRTLEYGKTWRYRAFECTSRRVGLTCTSRGGHSLFLSRESWDGR